MSKSTVVDELTYWIGEAERLAGKLKDRERRIRLARHWLFSAGGNREARRILDLRRPLRRKTK